MNNAYLLGRDGTKIPVLNHPSADFEFDSVLRVLTEYMDDDAKELAGQYINNPSEPTKQSILKVYNNFWCKVRSWDNDKLITFRIASSNKFSWHATIVRFLIEHPCYKNFKVTVESDKSTGINKTFWDEIPYGEALLSTYDNSIVVTIYLKPLIYSNSPFLCEVSDSENNSGKCINGSWSEYGEQLENPVKNEWNHFIQDCEYLMTENGLKRFASKQTDGSDKAEYVAFYRKNGADFATLILGLKVADNPFDDTFPEALRPGASEYLKINNMLNGDAAKAGIDFVVEKIQVGNIATDSWDKAFNRMQNRLDIINVHHSLTNFSTYNEYPVLQKITISIDSDITKYVESRDSFDGGILEDTQVVADWMSFMDTVEGVIEFEENFSLGTTETGKGLPIDPNVPSSRCYYVDVENNNGEIVCHLEVDFQFSTHTSIDKFNIRKNTIQVVQETTYPVDTDSGQPSQIIIKRDYSDYDLAMLAVIEMLNEIGK